MREPVIFHIDVNSAFLSWTALARLEQGDPVDLRTIPSIVGGDTSTRHGVVLAKSIPAKAFGITTGEPVVNALRKCPHLVMASMNVIWTIRPLRGTTPLPRKPLLSFVTLFLKNLNLR